jgi:hypothetical protein
MKIKDLVNESDFADLGLKGLGSELDKDDDYDPAKDGFSMVDQLGKVLDSRGNPNPLDSVKTRDGSEIKITADQAASLMRLLKRETVNGTDRQEKEKFSRDITTKTGLTPFLDANDGKSMQQMYVQNYMSDITKMALQNKSRM